ncbi:MAG: helix-turn-helix domain-containing protein [Planctomycetota bacterium]
MKANRNPGRDTGNPKPPPASARLLAWLSHNGRTQSWLADALCVTTGAVSLWLSGKRRPDVTRMVALEAAAGIPVKMWLGEGEASVVPDLVQSLLGDVYDESAAV